MRFVGIGLGLAIVLAFFVWPREESGIPAAAAPISVPKPVAEPEGQPLAPAASEPVRREAAGTLTPAPETPAESQPPLSAVQHEILVLDQDRKPVAGIAYVATWSLDVGPRFLGTDRVTDTAGRGHLAALPAENQQPQFVQLGFFSAESVGARLPAAGEASRRTEILIPPYGSIRVEAAPEVAQFSTVMLFQEPRALGGAFGSLADSLQLQDGRARIPFVGLGGTWIVGLRAETGGGYLRRTVQGPAAPGEEILVRFESGVDPILTGILLDETGSPLSSTELQFMLRSPDVNSGSNVRTNEAGRFTIVLTDEQLKSQPQSLEFRRYLSTGRSGFGSHEEDPSALARIDLPQQLPRRVLDLGEIRFVAAPVLAAGIVRDANGNPVADVNLFVDELQYTSPSGEDLWNHQNQLLRSRSAQDGRFTLYGGKPATALRLRASASAHLPEPPLPINYGEAGLEIVLEQGGSLTGVVTWVGGGDLSELKFTLESGAAPVPTRGSIDGDTYKMKVPAVSPATYALVGRIERSKEEFLRLPGIVIGMGGESTDPRLQPLDLNAYLGVVTVAPRTADGILPESCMVLRLRENGGGGRNISSPDGTARLPILPGGAADLLIEASGFRSVYLPRASGEQTPRLEPDFSVTIRLRGDAALSNEHGSFSIQAEPAADAGWPRLLLNHARRQVELRADRSASFSSQVLGTWRVSLLVPRMGSSGNAYPETLPIGQIVIGAGDAERVYELDLPEMPN